MKNTPVTILSPHQLMCIILPDSFATPCFFQQLASFNLIYNLEHDAVPCSRSKIKFKGPGNCNKHCALQELCKIMYFHSY